MSGFLDVGIAAAMAAGEIIRAGCRDLKSVEVQAKGAGDVVTSVDRAAETAIVSLLRASFPGHAFLGEEGGASGGGDYVWIIDPIDGTLNFSRGVPHFCVSIALALHGNVITAIVLDPLRGELFWAEQGCGAWLNGTRLHVTACARLEQALLATVFPKPGSALLARFAPTLLRALTQAGGLRRSGSMVLDLAYVAAGRLDGFWQFGMQPWDIAAGALLVAEAGGRVAPIDDEADLLNAQSLIACGRNLFDVLRQLCDADQRA